MLFLLPLPLSLSLLLLLLLLSHVKLNFVTGNTIIDLFVEVEQNAFSASASLQSVKNASTTIFFAIGGSKEKCQNCLEKKNLILNLASMLEPTWLQNMVYFVNEDA